MMKKIQFCFQVALFTGPDQIFTRKLDTVGLAALVLYGMVFAREDNI
jgi:hypothetical protein